jgi:hypothetical protein
MYDPTSIPGKHKTLTHAEDEFGQYGSIFLPDEEHQVPAFSPEIQLPPLSE